MSVPRILMLGPDLSVLGGMTSVQHAYFTHWQADRYSIKHIPTYTQGSKLNKLRVVLWAFWQYIYLLVVWRPALVHIHFSERAGFYRESVFALIGLIARPAVVMHCHSPEFKEFYQSQSTGLRRYIGFVLNHVDLLIVLSRRWQLYFESLSIHAPITVLNNPIEVPALAQTQGRAQTKSVILTLGELGKRKGTYDTLQAIPHILEQHPNVEFWFGGDGDVDQARQLISDYGWGDHVRLLGWVTGAEKTQVWQQSAIFLLPSYAEGLPIAVLEAMAWALPVITTPVGGLPDLISNEVNGCLIEPGDIGGITRAVDRLLTDPDYAQRLGKAARQTVEHQFAVDNILRELYNAYAAVLATNSSNR